MSQSSIGRRRHEPRPGAERGTDTQQDVAADTLLSLLGDEYAVDILRQLSSEPATACDLAETLESSRSTVYRRLNRLEEAGLVRSSLVYNPDGHHKQEYEVAIDRVQFDIGDGSLEVDELT